MVNKKLSIIRLARKQHVIHSGEVEAMGISRSYIHHLYKDHILKKVGRGFYMLHDQEPMEGLEYIIICKKIPCAVISLTSALHFHGLLKTPDSPTHIAIPRRCWKPGGDFKHLEVSYLSDQYYTYGLETHYLHSLPIKVYSPAKTLADCFKFKRKIKLEVAIEALNEALDQKKTSWNMLLEAGEQCKVKPLMLHYMKLAKESPPQKFQAANLRYV
jgi:predicted transcriptional regulator of viral defense system